MINPIRKQIEKLFGSERKKMRKWKEDERKK